MSLDRRSFIVSSLGVAAASVAAMPLVANAQNSTDTLVLPATLESRCATCAYWGGQRSVNREKTQVSVRSFGACNNSQSPMFGQTTSPEHGPMNVWLKWPALQA
ncbi:MAG: hypothetical protein Q7L07_12135 [Pseudohongiella sp.]|nr:hypothetical protein [Pseudohongiella sp.]MDP2283719.1 hypothetical protein [Pseudohongiella sp.]